MTLAFRNKLLTFFTLATLAITILFTVVSVILIQNYGWGAKLAAAHNHVFWFVYAAVGDASLSSNLLSIGPILLGCLGGIVYLRHVFRKTTSPEVFFAAAFLFSLSFESLRLLQFFVSLENAPFFFGLLTTRVVYLFRIFGLLSLFFGSLYVFDFQYQKYGSILGLCFVGSLLVSAAVPIDTVNLNTNLLFNLADERGLGFFFLTFEFIILVNYGLSILKKRTRPVVLLAVSQLLLLAAWQLALFNQPWALILLIPAVILLGRKAQELYLWN